MLEAYIYDGLRTPFGRHAGALSRVRPDDLLAGVVKEVVARSGFSPEIIDDVSVGCASQAGCRFVERILTVVQTRRLQEKNVLDYLHDALDAHRAGRPCPQLLSEG